MKKDITTKDTIKTITYDIAKYILELNVTDIEFVDKELQRVEKREADIVALCNINGIKSILHIEIQNSNDKFMAKRMLRYYIDIKFIYDNIPIYQYLIYIGKPKLKMDNFIKDIDVSFKYNIINMKDIDCEKFIKQDTPDALVLSILCDFKNKNKIDIIKYILVRLKELTKDDEYALSHYMLILETLSQNRNLQTEIKEVDKMLREINYKELPITGKYYREGIKEGEEKGRIEGEVKGRIEGAIVLIDKFGLSFEAVSKELNISIAELKKYKINNG
jgi:predicted transposase/invertase (TIGR01784 family)